MAAYLFGCGPGWLGAAAARIAERHGATMVDYTDPGTCACGRGCPDRRHSRRHWFESPNMGAPFDGKRAEAVMANLRAAKIIREAA